MLYREYKEKYYYSFNEHKFINKEKLSKQNDELASDGYRVIALANGIIKKSEDNATELFGTLRTFYSTEGSTHCIKSMIALA